MKKKRQKINFHELRYPKRLKSKVALMSPERLGELYTEWVDFVGQFTSRGGFKWDIDFCSAEFHEWFNSDDCRWRNEDDFLKFRGWYEKNKEVLTSPMFQHYKAEQEAQKAALQERFSSLDPIKYHYEVSLGYIGRWLTILEKWYKEEVVTYELVQALLLEVAITEFVFLQETASVRESQEYKDWFLKNEADDLFPQIRNRGPQDWKWQALKSDKGWGDRACAEAIVSDVRGRVSSGNPDEEVLGLIAGERARFSSSDKHFEYYRSSVIASCFSSDSITVKAPWLLEGIEKCLQAWDARDRSSGWDALATEQQEEDRAFLEKLRNGQTENEDL